MAVIIFNDHYFFDSDMYYMYVDKSISNKCDIIIINYESIHLDQCFPMIMTYQYIAKIFQIYRKNYIYFIMIYISKNIQL